jgi:hypothetical protein
MTSDGYQRAADVFDKVRDLPESEQAAAIDVACAGSSQLREQVLRLLNAPSKTQRACLFQIRPAFLRLAQS